jgi:hypothetical protein
MLMKNSNNTIVNRTRDVPVCSAVPQPTAPLRAHLKLNMNVKIVIVKIRKYAWRKLYHTITNILY